MASVPTSRRLRARQSNIPQFVSGEPHVMRSTFSTASSVSSSLRYPSSSACSVATDITTESRADNATDVFDCPIRVVARIRPLRQQEVIRGCRTAIQPVRDNTFYKNKSTEYPRSGIPQPNSRAHASRLPPPSGGLVPSSSASVTTTTTATTMTTLNPLLPKSVNRITNHTGTPSRSPMGGKNVLASNTPSSRGAHKTPMLIDHTTATDRPAHGSSNAGISGSRSLIAMDENKHLFNFHAVLKDNTNQRETYERSVGKALRQNLAKGYNTTIIAMGQDESGKSYTMSGGWKTKRNERSSHRKHGHGSGHSNRSSTLRQTEFAISREDGILPRAIHDMFLVKRRHQRGDVTIEMTFVEIIDNHGFDLLSETWAAQDLDIEYTPEAGVQMKGVTRKIVHTATGVKKLMAKAFQKRSRQPIQRGHLVCEFQVQFHPRASATASTGRHAKLTMVNIVGHETMVDEDGFETADDFASSDLEALEEVIDCLHQEKGVHDIPYGASTITRLLQDALGGNSYTVMLACVSPSDEGIGGSMETLEIARKAMTVTNKAHRNKGVIIQPPSQHARVLFDGQSTTSTRGGESETATRPEVQEVRVPSRSAAASGRSISSVKTKSSISTGTGSRLKPPTRATSKESKRTIPVPQTRVSRLNRISPRSNASSISDDTTSFSDDDRTSVEFTDRLEKELKVTRKRLSNEIAMTDKLSKLRDTLKKRCKIQEQEIEELKSDVKKSDQTAEELRMEVRDLRFALAGEKKLRDQVEKFRAFCENQYGLRSMENNALMLAVASQLTNNPTNISEEFLRQRINIAKPSLALPPASNSSNIYSRSHSHTNSGMQILAQNSSEIVEILEKVASDKPTSPKQEAPSGFLEILDNDDSGDVFEGVEDQKADESSVSSEESRGVERVLRKQPSMSTMSSEIRRRAEMMLQLADDAINSKRSASFSNSSSNDTSEEDHVMSVTEQQSPKATKSIAAIDTPQEDRPSNNQMVESLTQSHRNSKVVISNLEQMRLNKKQCLCQSNFMTGKSETAEFYLPRLAVACTCGEQKKDTDPQLAADEVLLLCNILRPWQAEFLQSLDVTTANEFVDMYDNDGSALVTALQEWKKNNKVANTKMTSCGVALHIWARTCKCVMWSCDEQRARGVEKPKRPEFLEVTPACGQSLSTLGI